MKAFSLFLIGLAPILPAYSQAQFEVATIKPYVGDGRISNSARLRNGTLMAENVTLRGMLAVAYGIPEKRIEGPASLDADRFDLAGKAPDGVADTEIEPLLQSLLHARFGVQTHWETRETAVYNMSVMKSGLRMEPFDPSHPPQPPRNSGQHVYMGVGTMEQLADGLTYLAGKPVINQTGVEGRYSYVISYAPLEAVPSDSTAGPGVPDIFGAVQQQLGVLLDAAKAPIRFLVVDHAERKPTEN